MPSQTSQSKPRVIKLPGQRRRGLATAVRKLHPLHSSPLPASRTPKSHIRVVCISDTHNTQPDLPSGDVLIHAGDLTENGSFDEVQEQLTWLSSQPHQYKLAIAGNHDVLLDAAFLERYPERRYGQDKTMQDLEWGSVHYLRDSSITLSFPSDDNRRLEARSLTVYGSPWTPRYGVSAFQYPRDQDVWADRIPATADVVIVHGPPRLHLDTRDFYRAGCQFLAQEVARVRPRLVVFGHIHVSYGREDVVLDGTQRAYEEIMADWPAWGMLVWMAAQVLFARVYSVFRSRERALKTEKFTTFVNASVVAGPENKLVNQPIVVEL